MITEDYCSYEVSKLLKEKGFNVPCLAHWHIGNDGHEKFSDYPFNWNEKVKNDLGWLSCPTHQMAMKWLREKGIYFSLVPFIENVGWPKDTWHINFYNSDGIIGGGFPVKGYEEAVEEALKYSLENLI